MVEFKQTPQPMEHSESTQSAQCDPRRAPRPNVAPNVSPDFAKSAPDIVFYEPCIPGNTGNAIRLAAVVGCTLHLIEPLGFEMDSARLKRAGLDYHDVAHVKIHKSFDEFTKTLTDDQNLYAFTTFTETHYQDVEYKVNDVLLFGPEPSGLPTEILGHPRVSACLRIPMREGVRSLNLAVSASIAVYEAWRQLGFSGGI